MEYNTCLLNSHDLNPLNIQFGEPLTCCHKIRDLKHVKEMFDSCWETVTQSRLD